MSEVRITAWLRLEGISGPTHLQQGHHPEQDVQHNIQVAFGDLQEAALSPSLAPVPVLNHHVPVSYAMSFLHEQINAPQFTGICVNPRSFENQNVKDWKDQTPC